jgi:hypothetical protein
MTVLMTRTSGMPPAIARAIAKKKVVRFGNRCVSGVLKDDPTYRYLALATWEAFEILESDDGLQRRIRAALEPGSIEKLRKSIKPEDEASLDLGIIASFNPDNRVESEDEVPPSPDTIRLYPRVYTSDWNNRKTFGLTTPQEVEAFNSAERMFRSGEFGMHRKVFFALSWITTSGLDSLSENLYGRLLSMLDRHYRGWRLSHIAVVDRQLCSTVEELEDGSYKLTFLRGQLENHDQNAKPTVS